MENIGSRIKQSRKRIGVTQQQLANLVNITQTNISDYERSKTVPSVGTLLKISGVCRVSVHWLVTGESCNKEFEQLEGEDNLVLDPTRFRLSVKIVYEAVQSGFSSLSSEKFSELVFSLYKYMTIDKEFAKKIDNIEKVEEVLKILLL